MCNNKPHIWGSVDRRYGRTGLPREVRILHDEALRTAQLHAMYKLKKRLGTAKDGYFQFLLDDDGA